MRGDLYTLWTPLGTIGYDLGGLALCLGSHQCEGLQKACGQPYIHAHPGRPRWEKGYLAADPRSLSKEYGLRWGTAVYEPGDAVLFGMRIVHASIENRTNRFRISSDTRYQLASEPVDEKHMEAGDDFIQTGYWDGFQNRGRSDG